MEYIKWESILDSFFDQDTMSVHFKENVHILRKKWRPWWWISEIMDEMPSKSYLNNLINELFKEIEKKENAFLEIDRNFSKVLQIWPFRIVIVLPPLSDGIEITVVKPVIKLNLDDYNLDNDIIDMLKNKAQWILISWSPWEWKTTFAQALVEMYVKKDKVVKTIESPRDLLVPNEVTQYSFSYAPHSEIRDILLLSRPDYTVYDEIRNSEDFKLFKDLRLTGIWLIWVIHATKPVDGIQRFIWTIEMWVIPQVIDTVIFIKWWQIEKILWLQQVVKVPEWMESDDLARPVILVTEYWSDQVIYEIYSYGEQVIVMPLDIVAKYQESKISPMWEYACRYLEGYLEKLLWFSVIIKPEGSLWIKIYVNDKFKWRIIWKWWEKIQDLEKKIWLHISVKTLDEIPENKITISKTDTTNQQNKDEIKITYPKGKKTFIILQFPTNYAKKNINLKIWNDVMKFTVDSNAEIVLKKKNMIKAIEESWIIIV